MNYQWNNEERACMLLLPSCLTLWDSMDCSLPGSFVHGILQASILEWVAIPFSRGSSLPRDLTRVSCIAGRFFTPKPMGKPIMKNIFPEIKYVPVVNRLFNHSMYWMNRDKKIPHPLIGRHFVTVGSENRERERERERERWYRYRGKEEEEGEGRGGGKRAVHTMNQESKGH